MRGLALALLPGMNTTTFSLLHRRTARGFTLIELLASITIVALLAALLMSGLGNIQARGRAVKCVANLRQIAVAAQSWSGENNQQTLPAFLNGETGFFDPNTWTGLLAPYLSYPPIQTLTSVSQMPVFVCPENPLRGGYGQNYLYLSWSPKASYGHWTPYSSVKQPSQTIFFTDNYTIGNPLKWRGFVRPPSMNSQADSMPSFVHPGKTANVLWLDGHITSEKNDSAMTKDDKLWDTN